MNQPQTHSHSAHDAAAPSATRAPLGLFALVTALTIILDQASKIVAVEHLSDGRQIELLGSWLSVELTRNSGAALSFAAQHTWVFTIIATVAIGAITYYARNLRSRLWMTVFGLVAGGAAGNLIDRILRAPGVFRGHVVDFINYNQWFIGNVADIAITVAVTLTVILTLRGIPMGEDE